MPIDKSKIRWDAEPAAPAIDVKSVKWDEPKKPGPLTDKPVDLRSQSIMDDPMLQRTLNYDATDARGGIASGFSNIGATLLSPLDFLARKVNNGKPLNVGGYDVLGQDRRAQSKSALQSMGVDTDSTQFKTNELLTEIGATSGVGSTLAGGAKAIGAGPALVNSLKTGGMNVAGKTGVSGLATRALGGSITGGATAGLVNPDQAGTGALIGGVIPTAAKLGYEVAAAGGRALRGAAPSAEVANLANRAKELGIDVPADRIVNSKPLNAVASSLEYMPFSGRTATINRMNEQMNTALSRSMGQDTSNVTKAVRDASKALGDEFDRVLTSNSVQMTPKFMDDLAEAANTAVRELPEDQAGVIVRQVDDIMAKAQSGQIDGKAAYNIKRTLDRIGSRRTPEAAYALDLKRSLMDALNESLGAEKAAAFATTRKQYGNMIALEKIAKNGAEGDVSIAKLANMRNINNRDLQELADIASQFMVTRENPHGALQRLVIGSSALTAGGVSGGAALPIAVGSMAAGRGANAALNSNTIRRGLLGEALPITESLGEGLLGTTTRAAPLLLSRPDR
jgi:hypothetical protein